MLQSSVHMELSIESHSRVERRPNSQSRSGLRVRVVLVKTFGGRMCCGTIGKGEEREEASFKLLFRSP